MEDLRQNGQRAKNAIFLIWIVLVLEIVSFISEYFQYNLLQSAASGNQISTIEATANDTREQIIGVFYFIAYIFSAITFIKWFRRAYYNLHIKVNRLSFTEGWAAGSWFVPVVNFYRPYQIMKELYHETMNLLKKTELNNNQSLSAYTLGSWWTLWIISNVFDYFVFRYSMNAESINELTVSTIASMVGNIIGIPLALITVKIIREYSNIEPILIKINGKTEEPTIN